MTPTEQLRQRVIDHLGGRFDNEKRSLRAFAAESGVGFNTIARFVRGNQITSDVFDRLSAALASDAGSVGALNESESGRDLPELADAHTSALDGPTPTLDVDRLARALKSVLPWDDDPWIAEQAAAIAAAYDAERQGDAGEGQ